MNAPESLIEARSVAMCHDCGMDLESAAEWHPWVFCLLFKQGIDDPEAHLRELGYTREATP